MSNMEIWDKLRTPPPDALKTIKGGRLSGFTDISPMWRFKILTEHFGPCGIGWKYDIERLWTETGSEEQVMAFAEISLYIESDGKWSAAIPGVGGSMIVTKESKGMHSSDEGFKMAVTDALSTAMKMIGVAADIYMGLWDGSKYKDAPSEPKKKDSIDTEKRDYKGARSELELLTGSGEAFEKIMKDLKCSTWNDFKTDAQKDKLWTAMQEAIERITKEKQGA